MESTFQGAKVWSSEVGEFVDQRHVDLAYLINAYDPRFSLAYIPQRDRGAFGAEKPFMIQERRNDGSVADIRGLTYAEMSEPGKILAWIAKGDIARRGAATVYQELELERLANEALAEKRREEEREDRRDMMATVAAGGRDRKHYFRHNGSTFRR